MVAPHVMYSTAFFVLAMALIVVARPPQVFDSAGRPRPFGVGPTQTMLSLGVITVVLAILSLFFFAILDLDRGR